MYIYNREEVDCASLTLLQKHPGYVTLFDEVNVVACIAQTWIIRFPTGNESLKFLHHHKK